MGDDGADDGADDDADGGDGDGDSDDGTDGDPGTACGEPQSCNQSPGLPAGVGLNSVAPYGCGGSGFELAWTQEAGGGGAKAVPRVSDLDEDGAPDIFMVPRKGGAWLFRGAGDGTFEFIDNLPGLSFVCGWGPDLGDLDGDGRIDIAIGDHCEGARAWSNQGGLSFSSADAGLVGENTYSGCGLGDVSGDGNLDIFCGADQFATGYSLAFGDGKGGWTVQSPAGIPLYQRVQGLVNGPQNMGHIAFADYDHDDDLDIFAFGQYGGGTVRAYVYQNGGDGTSWTAVATLSGGDASWVGKVVQGAIGDLDCDGNIDVAAGGTVYLGTGTSWTQAATVDGAEISDLGDIDGDGHLDLVTHTREAGVVVYINDGTGTTFAPTQTGVPFPAEYWEPHGIDLADVDGDGRLDIVRWAEVSNDFNHLEVWLQQP
jgi:hypothetical protein